VTTIKIGFILIKFYPCVKRNIKNLIKYNRQSNPVIRHCIIKETIVISKRFL